MIIFLIFGKLLLLLGLNVKQMRRLGFLKPSFQCIELQLEGIAKPFFLKLNFNWGGCQEEYIGQTGSLLKERVSLYKQHIQYPQYPILKVGQHIYELSEKGRLQYFRFFKLKKTTKHYEKPTKISLWKNSTHITLCNIT